jgi:hypothetical protein
LDSGDFHLEFLGDRRFKSDDEVKSAVKAWLNGLAAEGCDEDILKLATGCDKYLHDCVGK